VERTGAGRKGLKSAASSPGKHWTQAERIWRGALRIQSTAPDCRLRGAEKCYASAHRFFYILLFGGRSGVKDS
jgi:hypothetical protein